MLLYATNEFLTISLLPSAVAEIGGQRFYAWVTTVYLVASVVAATTVHSLLMRLGPRRAYLLGLTVFGAGSLGCALAPSMEVLLLGRTVQGFAGGLLAGLGYAVINTALPNTLWTKASALVSAMWGIGTLIGPAAGGLFAQFGHWRPSHCRPARLAGDGGSDRCRGGAGGRVPVRGPVAGPTSPASVRVCSPTRRVRSAFSAHSCAMSFAAGASLTRIGPIKGVIRCR